MESVTTKAKQDMTPKDNCQDSDVFDTCSYFEASDDEDSDEDLEGDEGLFSAQVLSKWKARANAIENPCAVAAWMLSPVLEIMEDWKNHHTGDHRHILGELAMRLFVPMKDFSSDKQHKKAAVDDLLNEFWPEYQDFKSKTNCFDHDEYMWQSSYLHYNQSHLLHNTFSRPTTKHLGCLACIVSSKPLGIGSAERCWGTVKTVKGGQ